MLFGKVGRVLWVASHTHTQLVNAPTEFIYRVGLKSLDFSAESSHRIILNCHRDSHTWVWLLWVEYLQNALVDLGVLAECWKANECC